MSVPMNSAHSFYVRTSDGELCCRVCLGLRGGHDTQCALLALRGQLQELSAQLGLYVAQVRETLDSVEQLIHGAETP